MKNNFRLVTGGLVFSACLATPASAFVTPLAPLLAKRCGVAGATPVPSVPPLGEENHAFCQLASPITAPQSGRGQDGNVVVGLGITGIFERVGSLFRDNRDEETCLPQDPKANKEARKMQLEENQENYRWSTVKIPVGTPYLEGFPPFQEFPTFPWITEVVGVLLRIVVGTIRGTAGATEIAEALQDEGRRETFLLRLKELIIDGKVNERPVDLEDYKELHAFPVKTPEAYYDYDDDETFARLRLQGANCVVLRKCSQATRDKLKILDSDPSYSALKTKVDSLLKDGKLFVVDHELLADQVTTPVDDIPRYLAPCVALFEVVDDDLLPIRSIGIQLSQGKEATPIFTPEDGQNWMIAKACFESAEFIIHEVVSHLGNTHIVLEGPMVAMNRQLPKEHPIYDLLQPHLEGTAFINWAAQNLLIGKDGGVDRLQANDIEDTWDLVLEQTLVRISKDFSPESDFAARQVTEAEFPGRYPYRDFGSMYWEATHTWVKEYLDLYYDSDKDMTEDYELEGFVREMTDVAQMKWLDDYYTTTDKKGLIAKVLASIIYTASTLHAAVNFPQRSSMSYVPSCPGSMFSPIPTDKSERNFQDYLDFHPPMEIATLHVTILTLLGSVYHTKLGDYDQDQFRDDRVREPLAKFQQSIEDIETDLTTENAYLINAWRGRGKSKKVAENFAYTMLLPDNIPQSTNI